MKNCFSEKVSHEEKGEKSKKKWTPAEEEKIKKRFASLLGCEHHQLFLTNACSVSVSRNTLSDTRTMDSGVEHMEEYSADFAVHFFLLLICLLP